jgi:hypothetical protein
MNDPDPNTPIVDAEEVLIDSGIVDKMLNVNDNQIALNGSAEPRKIGVAGAVFLILNKMIGTGSRIDAPQS